jgi:hypothetical protein
LVGDSFQHNNHKINILLDLVSCTVSYLRIRYADIYAAVRLFTFESPFNALGKNIFSFL